jgi:NRAMP (natural resistance-associated macrophage protein)-like metal ion transporter
MEKVKKVNFIKRIGLFLAIVGPGLITASADNDAPGIATYSMAGSRYGFNFLWLLIVVTFGEVIVQETAARLGAVTGKGTADLIRERFGVKVTFFAMLCLLVANLGTTVAQFAGIAAGAELLGVTRYIAVPVVSLFIMFLVLRGSYSKVEKFLLVLCLAALSYVVTAFLIKPDWGEIAKAAITPTIILETDYIFAVLATIGTTITPWGIFYMQASVVDKGVDEEDYHLTRADVVFGALWGNIISAFIIICTGAVLFTTGVHVEEAEQAAMALAPLAGEWSKLLFTTGLMGASILAAMVLPLSTVYAVTEAFGWERGLDNSRSEAPVFYGLYVAVILISVIIVMIPGIPLFPIMWLSQSINAILLPVLLVLLLKLANDKELLGKWVNKKRQNYLTIFLTILITVITIGLFAIPLFK